MTQLKSAPGSSGANDDAGVAGWRTAAEGKQRRKTVASGGFAGTHEPRAPCERPKAGERVARLLDHGSSFPEQGAGRAGGGAARMTSIAAVSFAADSDRMCGRVCGPPDLAKVATSVKGGEHAHGARTMLRRDAVEGNGRSWPKEEEEAFKAPIRDRYETAGSPCRAMARPPGNGVLPLSERRCARAPASSKRSAPAGLSRFDAPRLSSRSGFLP